MKKDEVVRQFADAVGANERTLTPPEEMEALRQARAQQAQQAAELAMAQQGAVAAKDGAAAIKSFTEAQQRPESGGQP